MRRQRRRPEAELPPTAWAMLGLLSFPGERTGYDLKKWADASLRFFYWSPAISQIYAELRRLEGLGYASSRRSEPDEPRAKRRYAITAAGRAALARWADTSEPGPPVLKHPLVLRIWLGHLAEPERLATRVREHMERTRAELKEIRDALARADAHDATGGGTGDGTGATGGGTGATGEGWRHPRIALRWSERHQLAELELAEAMLADLAEPHPPGARAPTEGDRADTGADTPADTAPTDG
ncbi:PadR family transcriptional regulator [Streptomyces daliensis]